MFWDHSERTVRMLVWVAIALLALDWLLSGGIAIRVTM